MSIRTSPWPDGVPCWADVMATDVRASGAFYSADCSEIVWRASRFPDAAELADYRNVLAEGFVPDHLVVLEEPRLPLFALPRRMGTWSAPLANGEVDACSAFTAAALIA